MTIGDVVPFQRPVNRRARWLDERAPGWHQHIDLDTLDLHSSRSCIIGQVASGSRDPLGLGEYRRRKLRQDAWCSESVNRVFFLQSYRPAWRRAVRARLRRDVRLALAAERVVAVEEELCVAGD